VEYFNLYKKGRYGWFHITSYKCENINNAIEFFKKEFYIKLGNDLFNYKVE
jgi:predicted enzyme related to lactoylglutathione lyase